jgi:alpha-ketoglutarate-dependent 2,4-dichlorophenoxyacetate dioxygenase
MKLTHLHPRFGVEVHDIDLRSVTATNGYPDIRQAFEQHSLLLFRNQALDDEGQLALGALFGPLEDRTMSGEKPKASSKVSNRTVEATLAGENDLQTLNLKANQLWHTDSIFLPVPALVNILAARVLSSRDGETEFVSTRAAWRDLPNDLKERVRGANFRHSFTHSRRKLSKELAMQEQFTKWSEQTWKALWRNPVNGEDALYLASHTFGVDNMSPSDSEALIAKLIEFATRPEMIYVHEWKIGDVLIWDERATLHRGRPWPYHEERTLASVCVSAGESDGLIDLMPQ